MSYIQLNNKQLNNLCSNAINKINIYAKSLDLINAKRVLPDIFDNIQEYKNSSWLDKFLGLSPWDTAGRFRTGLKINKEEQKFVLSCSKQEFIDYFLKKENIKKILYGISERSANYNIELTLEKNLYNINQLQKLCDAEYINVSKEDYSMLISYKEESYYR